MTDSFHACVFSILFHIPFWVVGNSARGLARFQSLLSLFGLENRLLNENDSIPNYIMEDSIDWKLVDIRLQNMRNKSISFLEELLK